MPQWAVVLTVLFSAVAATAAILGIIDSRITAARNSGRVEQKVDSLADEMVRQRANVSGCRLAEECDRQMGQMQDRVGNAHKRMDGIERRVERLEAGSRSV